MNIKLVFAFCKTKKVDGTDSYAFGLKDGLPWGHISQDMKNFKAATEGTTLLMGAKTFMSLPKVLPGRPSVVVINRSEKPRDLPKTKSGETAEYYIYSDDLVPFLKGESTAGFSAWNSYNYSTDMSMHTDYDNISVIGGKSILEVALPFANEIIRTKIVKKHYVMHDVYLDKIFLSEIINKFKWVRNCWWNIDELTDIYETQMIKR